MKKLTTIICLCVLVATFLFMFVFSVCLPRTVVSDYSILKEWPEFSVKTLFSGEYLKDVMYCFTDTIHARDTFIDFETRINDLYGLSQEQEIYTIYEESESPSEESSQPIVESSVEDNSSQDDSSDISTESSEESIEVSEESSATENSQVESSEAEESSKVEQVPPELSGSILIVGTRALEVYGGNPARAEEYAQTLNAFAEKMGDKVKIYSMVIPKASAYYIEQAKGYDKYIYRNKIDIDKISETLSDKVIDVNIYNILGLHASEEIYLRTDHHWSSLGAYYASSVFATKAGVGFNDISTFTEVRRENYVGTMYKYSDYNSTIKNNPEDFVVYYPNTEYTATYFNKSDLASNEFEHEKGLFWDISDSQRSSWYSTFIRGDSYSVKAVTSCKNGRKLLIVKDSYGNALAPYMLEGFEEIYIVDARAFEKPLDETIERLGITDVLFAECTFSAVGKSYIEHLKELCE